MQELVGHAVDGLIPARRSVVKMYLAGYGREEIADLLGWTEPKTRNLLYRGLADLREALTEMGIGPEAMND
jgi:RNA polymerase sigma-70 factor (ECF subfamily)